MSGQLVSLQDATIKQHCKMLRMPTIASQFSTLAEQAVREKQTHTGYLMRGICIVRFVRRWISDRWNGTNGRCR